MSENLAKRKPLDELKKVFRTFDLDDTGKITSDNLLKVAKDLGISISDEESRGMIYEAVRDRNGAVHLEDFLRIMKKAKLY